LPTLTAAIERDAEQARAYFRNRANAAIAATDRI
jgi:riboflavin kinase/FMN adenylyltransferase